MLQLLHVAAVMLVLLGGIAAQAQTNSNSLDSAENGGSTRLDAVDSGESVAPDTRSGGSRSLDSAKSPAQGQATSLLQPEPLPEIEDAAVRAQAQSSREAALVARQRVQQANAAYSRMITRDYPQGDARAAIVQERDAAAAAYQQASARYEAMLNQLQ